MLSTAATQHDLSSSLTSRDMSHQGPNLNTWFLAGTLLSTPTDSVLKASRGSFILTDRILSQLIKPHSWITAFASVTFIGLACATPEAEHDTASASSHESVRLPTEIGQTSERT